MSTTLISPIPIPVSVQSPEVFFSVKEDKNKQDCDKSEIKLSQKVTQDLESFPATICQWGHTYTYPKDKEERQEFVKVIASKIAQIYASFLTTEGRKNKKLIFPPIEPQSFPDQQEVDKFQQALRNKLISQIPSNLTTLSTKYRPHGILQDVLIDSNLSCYPKFGDNHYFPQCTLINVYDLGNAIMVTMCPGNKI